MYPQTVRDREKRHSRNSRTICAVWLREQPQQYVIDFYTHTHTQRVQFGRHMRTKNKQHHPEKAGAEYSLTHSLTHRVEYRRYKSTCKHGERGARKTRHSATANSRECTRYAMRGGHTRASRTHTNCSGAGAARVAGIWLRNQSRVPFAVRTGLSNSQRRSLCVLSYCVFVTERYEI